MYICEWVMYHSIHVRITQLRSKLQLNKGTNRNSDATRWSSCRGRAVVDDACYATHAHELVNRFMNLVRYEKTLGRVN